MLYLDWLLGKTEDRRRGWQRMRWLNGITYSMDMSLSKLWEIVKGDSEGNLVFCSLQSHKESDMTEHARKFPYSSCLSTLQNFSCSLFWPQILNILGQIIWWKGNLKKSLWKKNKNRASVWLSNSTTRHIPWENHNSKRYMCPKFHCSQDMEAT